MKTNGNDSAYPIEKWNTNYKMLSGGLTKREYFAAKAMSVFLSHSSYYSGNNNQLARVSVELADALISELNKEQS